MSLIYNATFDSGTRVLSLLDKAGNVISSCEVPSKELVDDITKPLTFRATQDGSTVTLYKHKDSDGEFQTSRDGGSTWEDYTIGSRITLNTGDEVSFLVKKNRSPYQYVSYNCHFEMRGKIEAWHNVMSMYRKDDFATYDTAVGSVFYGLFENCTSLTKAPALPATKALSFCYKVMFSGCRSLIKAPELPATTLRQQCYFRMFQGCQSLIKAPELPATTLDSNCYYAMFSECRSLTKAPTLPATRIKDGGYYAMFSGCQSLNEVRIAATIRESKAMDNWLEGVSATGDFYCDPNATIFPTGTSGIPENWRRLNIADYPN